MALVAFLSTPGRRIAPGGIRRDGLRVSAARFK